MKCNVPSILQFLQELLFLLFRYTMLALKYYRDKLFSVGASEEDDSTQRREKRVLLGIHYLLMAGGPLPTIILYLLCGLKWIALVIVHCNSTHLWQLRLVLL